MASAGRSRWTARTGKVTFAYASGESLVAEPTVGNFSIGGMNAENFETVKVLNRTKHDGFVEGADLVQDVSIDMQFPRETLTDPGSARLLDFFLKTGSFAGAASCDPVIKGTWRVFLDLDDGAGTTGRAELPLVEGEITITEGEEFDTVGFAGRNHLKPIFT
jgi:hypothetical protein